MKFCAHMGVSGIIAGKHTSSGGDTGGTHMGGEHYIPLLNWEQSELKQQVCMQK